MSVTIFVVLAGCIHFVGLTWYNIFPVSASIMQAASAPVDGTAA